MPYKLQLEISQKKLCHILNLYTEVTSCTTSENINAFQFVIKLKNNIQQNSIL